MPRQSNQVTIPLRPVAIAKSMLASPLPGIAQELVVFHEDNVGSARCSVVRRNQ
jgi:hypothetical protein